MQPRDAERWLLQQIMGTAELLGQNLSANAAAMLAEDLAGYPQDVLAKAFSRVRDSHTGPLTPKAFLDRIDEVSGRPNASEAWAMAVNALDERKTVVWTVEMMEAWGVVSDLAQRGDLIGARMGFIQAYERLVRIARDERQMPQVQVSMGWDRELVGPAVEKAIELGYMVPSRHASELTRIGYQPSETMRKALQLEYRNGPDRPPVKVAALPAPAGEAVHKGFHPAIAARLAAAKQALQDKPEQVRLSREEQRRAEDEELQRRKDEAQRRVDERLREGGAQ